MHPHVPPAPSAAVSPAASRRRPGPVALGALAAVHAPPSLALVVGALAAPAAGPPVAAPGETPDVRYVERGGVWYPIRRRGVYVSEFLSAGALVLYTVKADGDVGLWKRVAEGQTAAEVAAELWAWLDAEDRVAALV